jgi:hypothetical protein
MRWPRSRRRLGVDHARNWQRRDEEVAPRPRVLFESPDGAEAQAVWSLLRRQGYETMWCPGPPGNDASACELIRTGHCRLLAEADVVVSALDPLDGSCDEVARYLDAGARDGTSPKPVVVVPRRAKRDRVPVLAHSDIVSGPLSSKALLRAVARAAARSDPTETDVAG